MQGKSFDKKTPFVSVPSVLKMHQPQTNGAVHAFCVYSPCCVIFVLLLLPSSLFQESAKQNTCNNQHDTSA